MERRKKIKDSNVFFFLFDSMEKYQKILNRMSKVLKNRYIWFVIIP